MLRRDYILRMIEEFVKALARIRSLKKDQRWAEAQEELQGQLGALASLSLDQLVQLSETELLASVCQNEPSQTVRPKMLLLATLLNEAGDVAANQGGAEMARQYYLKALNVLLSTLAREDA